MNATPMPIALRAHTVRQRLATASEGAPPSVPRPKRTHRSQPRRPKHVLVIDTETTIDALQSLLFGCYRYSRILANGALVLIVEGLFYADGLATTDPAAFAALEVYATAHSLPLLSRREFVNRVFWPVAYEQQGMVVGFNLPFDLSRIAVDAGEARGHYRGGFSLALWDYFDAPSGEWRENKHRPRVCVKSLDSKRVFIGFTRPMTTGEQSGPTFRGHFLDVRTLAFALSAKSHSLASACAAFGVPHAKLSVEEHGRVTVDYIDYNRRDVLATEELLVTLLAEFDLLGLPLPPMRAFSPASIAKAYLRAFGLRPPRSKAPDISDADVGHAMTAFFGGRAECRIRRTPVPVVTVDFRSMYPTVNCLLGLWDVLIADRIGFVECTEAFRELLASLTLAQALDPRIWPLLRCFVEIEADDDIVPVRGKYSDTGEGLNIGVNRLTSPVPLWYAAPDVLASALLTGRAPRIRRARQLVGEGVQADLHSVALGGRISVDPRTMDFFRTVIEERVRVKRSPGYSPAERERIAQLLKIVANSGSYGIFAELNRDELATDETETITVFGHAAPFEQTTHTPEESGKLSFPPAAALIASAARLMYAMLECEVRERGGTHAFGDTDSMGIVATECGGLVECEGGGADMSDRIAAVRALPWDDVREIRERFNALNPYDRAIIPDILNIEDVNVRDGVQRQLYAYVVSAKRYALFSWNDDGSICLEKCSEHGLGHLINPLPTNSPHKWPDILWHIILAQEFDVWQEKPEFLTFPAISRISVSTPKYFRGFLRRWADLDYASRIKPFGFLMSAQVARFGHPDGVDPKHFHLVAPYTNNPGDWDKQVWTDTYSGREFAITTGLSYRPDVVRVRSIGDVLEEFLAHGEVKSATPNGEPAGASSRGVLVRRHVTPSELRPIGKESNALDAVEAGLIGDWDSVLSTYGSRTSTNAPPLALLMSASAATLAKTLGVSVRTVRAWRRRARALSTP